MKNFIVRILARKRRKDDRFKLHDGAVVVIDPHSEKKDKIIDISLGGLAFSYSNERKQFDEEFEVDIYIDNEIYLKKLKVKLISDIEIGEVPFESANVRRLSGQFMWLTTIQKSDLNSLFKKYGIGMA
jgi:hypothetical protein